MSPGPIPCPSTARAPLTCSHPRSGCGSHPCSARTSNPSRWLCRCRSLICHIGAAGNLQGHGQPELPTGGQVTGGPCARGQGQELCHGKEPTPSRANPTPCVGLFPNSNRRAWQNTVVQQPNGTTQGWGAQERALPSRPHPTHLRDGSGRAGRQPAAPSGSGSAGTARSGARPCCRDSCDSAPRGRCGGTAPRRRSIPPSGRCSCKLGGNQEGRLGPVGLG